MRSRSHRSELGFDTREGLDLEGVMRSSARPMTGSCPSQTARRSAQQAIHPPCAL